MSSTVPWAGGWAQQQRRFREVGELDSGAGGDCGVEPTGLNWELINFSGEYFNFNIAELTA